MRTRFLTASFAFIGVLAIAGCGDDAKPAAPVAPPTETPKVETKPGDAAKPDAAKPDATSTGTGAPADAAPKEEKK